jgi:hypothetical protein
MCTSRLTPTTVTICHQRLIRLPELAEYAAERPRWPGVAKLRVLLGLVDGRAESPMETRLRLLLHDAGAPAPIPQFEVQNSDGLFLARVGGHPGTALAPTRRPSRVTAESESAAAVIHFGADRDAVVIAAVQPAVGQ